MAIFGDLGKALGLGSAEDIFGEGDLLPILATAAGFYFAPALGLSAAAGAAGGAGLGSLAAGKSVNDALKNAAMAYGVGSFMSPSMTQGLQMGGGAGSPPSYLQNQIYGSGAGQAASVADTAAMENANIAGGETGFMDSLFSSAKKDPLLALSLGSSALGLLAGQPDDPDRTQRPYADVTGFDINVVDPATGETLNLKDPDDAKRYREAMTEERQNLYSDDMYQRIPGYAHGGAMVDHPDAHGAMYQHKKMGYDVAVRGEVDGPGTGTSDSVPARLSDGEFVLTAQAVRGAGGGDRDVGAARLYDMMAELEATA
jgi:hypothetical protein